VHNSGELLTILRDGKIDNFISTGSAITGCSDLRLENSSAMAKSSFSCVEKRFFPGSRHCAAVLQTQVPILRTDLDLSFLYILILETYSKFARKNNFLAHCVCFPQPCSSAGRMFATSRSRLQNYRRIVSFPQQKFR